MNWSCIRCGDKGWRRGAESFRTPGSGVFISTPPAPTPDTAAFASKLWDLSRPAAGTGAETYLRRGRSYGGPLPSVVRYLPFSRTGNHPHAMIARFGDPLTPVRAVHLTRLANDGQTRIEKRMLGPVSGSPIMLAPAGEELAITEGIEDALSIHEAAGCGAWAAGSAAHLAKLGSVVPDGVRSVLIAEDDNEAGRAAVAKLASALHARGMKVRILRVWQRCAA